MKHQTAIYATAAVQTAGVYITQQLTRFTYWVLGGKKITKEEAEDLRNHLRRVA